MALMKIREKHFIILSLGGESGDAKKSFVKSKKFSIIKGKVKPLKNKQRMNERIEILLHWSRKPFEERLGRKWWQISDGVGTAVTYIPHPKHSSGTRKKETSLSVGCRLVTRFDFISVQEVFAKRGPRHSTQDGDSCQSTEGRAHLRASRKREPAGSPSPEKEVLLRGPDR